MVLTNVLRPNKQVTAGFSDGGFFVDFVYLLDYTVNVAGAPPPPPFRFSLFGAKKSSQKKRRPDRLFVSGFSAAAKLALRSLRAQDELRTGAADYPKKSSTHTSLTGPQRQRL